MFKMHANTSRLSYVININIRRDIEEDCIITIEKTNQSIAQRGIQTLVANARSFIQCWTPQEPLAFAERAFVCDA